MDRVYETSVFKWSAVAALFRRAVVEREIRIPRAAMPGTATIRFGEDGKVEAHGEGPDVFASGGASPPPN